MIYIVGGILVFGIFVYSLAVSAAPKNDYERQLEDEAQMKYLKEWKEKNKI